MLLLCSEYQNFYSVNFIDENISSFLEVFITIKIFYYFISNSLYSPHIIAILKQEKISE